MWRRVWRWACGDCRSSTWRRVSSRFQRGWHRLGRIQRRNLQLRRPSPRARSPGTSLLHRQRHGNDRSRLRRVGRERVRHGCAACSPLRCGTAASATLLLARDRVGIKPLHYAVEGDRLYFGSEIKSILAARRKRAALDVEALDHYLSFLYTPARRDRSSRASANCRPAICCAGKTASSRCVSYWEVPADEVAPASDAEAVERLRSCSGMRCDRT